MILCALLLVTGTATAQETTTTTSLPSSTTTTTPETTTTVPPTTTTIPESTTTSIPGASTTTTSDVTTSTTIDAGPTWDWPPPGVRVLRLPRISFPISRGGAYSNTYLAPRDGGSRPHLGTDIFAPKGTPVVAVADGVVERLGENPVSGLYVVVRHYNGWRSAYVHLNDDSPGTDNGLAYGFGPGVRVGAEVTTGTVLGYVGDSGNAESTAPHLHFELHQPNGFKANPYPALRRAWRSKEISFLPTVDYTAVQTDNTGLISHHDPGSGFNGGIAVVDDDVYLGTWGTAERCPGTGIRVFDATDPSSPSAVGAFADHTEFPGTYSSALWAGDVTIESGAFRLAVVALTPCDPGRSRAFQGLAIYDSSEPEAAELLSTVPIENLRMSVPSLDIEVVDGDVIAAVAVPGSFKATSGEIGDLHIYDLTDPTVPQLKDHWNPTTTFSAVLSLNDPIVDGSVTRLLWVDGARLVTGHESGSLNVLELTSPDVELVRRIELTQAHVPVTDMTLVGDGYLWVSHAGGEASEDGLSGRLVDLTGGQPASLTAETGPALTDLTTTSSSAVVSSSAAGVTVIEADGATTVVTGSFVTAPAPDPQRWWSVDERDRAERTWEITSEETRSAIMVWDVATSGDFAYVSDHHSGLWIFSLPRSEEEPTLPN